ncbi:MAG: glycoside hydrolase family 140 protein [Planctomycetota bacterium]
MKTVLLSGILACGAAQDGGPSVDLSRGDLRVSENRRFLVHADGSPFFYLGDTAWELFHRLTRADAERYLENRRAKGFTVIQAVALAELDGLNTPNAYGDRPLADNDPFRPATTPGADPNDAAEYDYWDHVDFILDTAAAKGLYIGLLPTWGDKIRPKYWGTGPEIFDTEDKARAYGRFLGARYANRPNLIWILGGDRGAGETAHLWRAMASGILETDTSGHLITYHPWGGASSATWFHNDAWLAFNMIQSGHSSFDLANYEAISSDYGRSPAKPCMDGEPRYEDHPVNWNPANGWFNDYDVRQAAYWALFAGAHGHTYGCHDIWQMYAPGRAPISSARTYWYDALDLPGAWDMMHVRNLMLSRPFLSRVPDQSLIASGQASGAGHLRATRGDGYVFVYAPTGSTFEVRLGVLSGTTLRAWWFDPRTGAASLIGDVPNTGTQSFDPPGSPARGNDWVLVLDDASRGFATPGEVPPPASQGGSGGGSSGRCGATGFEAVLAFLAGIGVLRHRAASP